MKRLDLEPFAERSNLDKTRHVDPRKFVEQLCRLQRRLQFVYVDYMLHRHLTI